MRVKQSSRDSADITIYRNLYLLAHTRLVVVIAIFVFALEGISAPGQTGTALSSAAAMYARVLRLSYNPTPSLNGTLVASVTAFPGGGGEADIYASANGTSFTKVGAIQDPDFAGGLCCGTLFELSRQVGTMPAGTLLWAGSVGQNSTTQPMQIKIYQSANQGATWSYLSNCATAPGVDSKAGGLWEPEFTIASDGALICFYSDETQAGYSQLIHQIRTYDGINWQNAAYTVASAISTDRPGMPVVTLLPSGTYFMTYEYCGTGTCSAYFRTSADGWNWGTANNMGTRAVTAAGQWLEHAPYNTWATSAASANGTILLVGQMMYDQSGAVSAGNGITIFTNHSADGSGTWGTMPAPVQVPTAYNNPCPNYSSPLLASTDGSSVLEFASSYVGTVCTMYYGSGPILAGVDPPTITVKPATSTVTAYPLQVTVTLTGSGTLPTPTGTVTLTLGTYSASQALTGGVASFSIPGPLSSGAATISAAYSGNSNYTAGTGTAAVTINVPVPGISVSASALSIAPGATTGNTSTITVTPTGGFTGNVALSATILSSPANAVAPIFSFGATSPVSITGTGSGTATLTVDTTASVSAAVARPAQPASLLRGTGMIALAGLLLIGVPGGRRFRNLLRACGGLIVLCLCIGVTCGGLSGCGGSSGSATGIAGTTPGNYLLQITATSSSGTATGDLTLTIQ